MYINYSSLNANRGIVNESITDLSLWTTKRFNRKRASILNKKCLRTRKSNKTHQSSGTKQFPRNVEYRNTVNIHYLPRWAFSALWYMASCRALICPLFSLTTCSFSLLPFLPDTAGSLPPDAANVVPCRLDFLGKEFKRFEMTVCLPVGNEWGVFGQMSAEKLLPLGSLRATELPHWRCRWPDAIIIYAWRRVDRGLLTRR